MTKPFKVGDRVRAYTYCYNAKGVIIEVDKEGLLLVKWDAGSKPDYLDIPSLMHPKQCRRLRKKKRREIFLRISDVMEESQCVGALTYPLQGYVRFIEAKERKKK